MSCLGRLRRRLGSCRRARVFFVRKSVTTHGLRLMRRFVGNRRGISSIFMTIYIALIVVLLISALFAAQVISRSSLVEYLKTEQERRQEQIQITKISTDSNDLNFVSVEILVI